MPSSCINLGIPDIDAVFDRRRRDPLWRITEKLSGEDKITKKAVSLFYEQIEGLIRRRLYDTKGYYEAGEDAGVDLLDLFLQSTTDEYELSGMVFGILSAGREWIQYPLTIIV